MIDEGCVLTPAPGVLAAYVGGETVLWSEGAGVYYGLDEVGTRVWQLSAEGRALHEIQAALLSEYNVEPSVLRDDLDALAREWIALGLATGPTSGPVPCQPIQETV